LALELQVGDGVFPVRVESTAGGSGAVAGVQARAQCSGVGAQVEIRTVINRDRDASRRAALHQLEAVGVGLALGMQTTAVRSDLAGKIQHTSHAGAGIEETGSAKVSMLQSDLRLEGSARGILLIKRAGLALQLQRAAARGDRAESERHHAGGGDVPRGQAHILIDVLLDRAPMALSYAHFAVHDFESLD